MNRLMIGCWLLVAITLRAGAQEKASAADKEAAYAKAIEKRTQDILAALDLKDAGMASSVHDVVVGHYRALRDWHDAHDTKLKALNKRLNPPDAAEAQKAREEIAAVKNSLKTLHDGFLGRLSSVLTPEQVERVKDKLTYDVVRVTYNAYREMLPQLTEAQKGRILDMLKEAREEAMDGGSSEEKHAVFGRYKGRINNYLTGEGYDIKQASKDLAAKLKARAKSDNPPGAASK
jgi:hypothetical protein